MPFTDWLREPRRLLAILIVIVLLPSALLVVSAWRLLRHADVAAVRDREASRDQMADDVGRALQQRVGAIRAQLREPGVQFDLSSDRDDFVFVVFTKDQVTTTPARRLLYYPVTVAGREASPQALETSAIGDAQQLRRVGRTDAALAAWTRAAGLKDTSVAGLPADLFARYAECDLLAEAGRTEELRVKAAALHSDLLAGRWQLNSTAFETNLEYAALWSGAPPPPRSVERSRALSAAVEWTWRKWKTSPAAVSGAGSDLLVVDDDSIGPPDGTQAGGHAFTLLWHADVDRLAVFAANVMFLDHEWLAGLTNAAGRQGLRIDLRAPDAPVPAWKETRRPAAETRLPWAIAVAHAVPPDRQARRDRLRLFLAGAALLSFIVVGGATVIARAAARELAIARLQSDFVAAVSHEFRTPLTSLRQIGEVLHDGRVSDERRHGYYEALVRQTGRLHHLVETLLDFGRMEAGRSPYRKEPLELSSWARSVVDQFNREVSARGYTVELHTGDQPLAVLADPHALTNAMWNLLDNAVKYSPDHHSISVTVDHSSGVALVHVRDRGLGIPATERHDIFQKFFRGADAKRRNIAGTGIGLAMVQHIMKAHGGAVHVDSQPGSGSTFTLEIPCHAS
jgi:signal transduction histidine kinase